MKDEQILCVLSAAYLNSRVVKFFVKDVFNNDLQLFNSRHCLPLFIQQDRVTKT